MAAQELNDRLFAQMMRMNPEADGLDIPPEIFLVMEGEFLDYREGHSLTVRFSVLEHYQNPMGFMQEGMIVAAVDNMLAPLSYLVAPPSVTTQLNISYCAARGLRGSAHPGRRPRAGSHAAAALPAGRGAQRGRKARSRLPYHVPDH